MEKVNRRLIESFVCPKCETRDAQVRHVATSGTGISRWLDIQHQEFAYVSCARCGYTEVYDLRTVRANVE
jgi:predicted nucleic-acid-binding Zn-ribbon protein